MRVGIDARSVSGEKAGFGQYTHCLLQALSEIDGKNNYIVFFWNKKTTNYAGFENHVEGLLRFPEVWEQFRLPFAALEERLDVLHCTGYPSPIIAACKKVMTLHDLSVYYFPECMPNKRTEAYWKFFFTMSTKSADAIITDSMNSKKDIVELLKVGEEKINVIPLAARDCFKPLREKEIALKAEALRKKYCLPESFVLFVGTIEPRKNILTLVKAFNELKKMGLEEKLVVVGKQGWKTAELFGFIRAAKLEKEIIFANYVLDEELPLFYNLASVFVYPSLYEGFGLPPLEAMQCGCPVIASNNSSLPEVMGKAGILLDARDESGFAKAIDSVLTDLRIRKKMVAAGLKQADKFSWKQTAEQTVAVYEKVFSC